MKIEKQYEKRPDIRRNVILRLIEEKAEVKVSYLSEMLNVSVVTIRNDLDQLENQHLLERIHGGARKCITSSEAPQLLHSNSTVHKADEKKIISRIAASMTKQGDFIFLNCGSTSLFICEELKKTANITIVTNSLAIINSAISTPSMRLFSLGGEINHDMQIMVGDDVLDQLNKYTADILFLGMDGVDIQMGATTYNHTEDSIIRKMILRSKKRYLVVDDSKIGRVTFAKVADLTEFDGIITNYTEQNAPLLNQMRSIGLEIITNSPASSL